MRAVAGELAFEENEAIDPEWFRSEIRVPSQEGVDRFGIAAVPARQGDVRLKMPGAPARARLVECALDLRGERGDRLLWLDAGPEGAAISLARIFRRRRRAVRTDGESQSLKRGSNVIGDRALDFSNKP